MIRGLKVAALPLLLAALPFSASAQPVAVSAQPLIAFELPLVCASPVLLAACVFDVRRRIIPDWTVLVLAGIGIGAAVLAGPLLPYLLAGLLSLALGALLAFFRLWGWGDAKLLGAAGLLVGFDGLMPLANVMGFTGAGLGLLLIGLRPPLRAGWLPLPPGAPRWLVAEHRRLRAAPSVPYGLAIAAGTLAGM